MAGWIYDPEERLIFEYREFPDTKDPVPITVAENVAPEFGPMIALVPRMEALIRAIIADEGGWDRYSPGCSCYRCSACEFLCEFDAAKEARRCP